MAPIPNRLVKKTPVPAAGVWFLDQEEAKNRPGFCIELRVSPTDTWHGVYPTQEEFCSHGTSFIVKYPCAPTVLQLRRLVLVHTALPLADIKKCSLSKKGRWFVHQLGAFAAVTPKPLGVLVKLVVKTDTPLILYGVFDDQDQMDSEQPCALIPPNYIIRHQGFVCFNDSNEQLEYEQPSCNGDRLGHTSQASFTGKTKTIHNYRTVPCLGFTIC